MQYKNEDEDVTNTKGDNDCSKIHISNFIHTQNNIKSSFNTYSFISFIKVNTLKLDKFSSTLNLILLLFLPNLKSFVFANNIILKFSIISEMTNLILILLTILNFLFFAFLLVNSILIYFFRPLLEYNVKFIVDYFDVKVIINGSNKIILICSKYKILLTLFE